MTLFWVAGVLFVVGLAMILLGDYLRKRGTRAAGVPDGFWPWFLEIVKKVFTKLTGDVGLGEKIAAAGTLLMAGAVIAFVAGIAVAGGDNGGTETTTTTSTTGAP